MKKALIALFILIPCTAAGETRIEQRLKDFQTIINTVAIDAGITPPIVRSSPTLVSSPPSIARVFKTADGIYMIEVYERVLVEGLDLGFQHIAQHEICHITLGHAGIFLSLELKEYQAERCVYEKVGEEMYLDFIDYAVSRDVDLRQNLGIDREVWRTYMRRAFKD
jgi:hypothetical protein